MKVLVINGSPKGERSDCMRLTRAFLRGMGETAETLEAVKARVLPCLGCFGCWRSDGVCVQKDDMAEILDKITLSDLVIWSAPLYCYGFPAPAKAIIDRMLPLTRPEQESDGQGGTRHPTRQDCKTRFMLISGCGFPNATRNFEALRTQFALLFGAESPVIACAEAPLLNIPEAAPLADMYLARVEDAGRAFARTGAIPDEIMAALDTPMLDPDIYRARCSGKA